MKNVLEFNQDPQDILALFSPVGFLFDVTLESFCLKENGKEKWFKGKVYIPKVNYKNSLSGGD